MICRFRGCEHKATKAIIICIHDADDKVITQSPPCIVCEEHVHKIKELTDISLIDPQKVYDEHGRYPDLQKSHHSVVDVEEISGNLDQLMEQLDALVQDPAKVKDLINKIEKTKFISQHIN